MRVISTFALQDQELKPARDFAESICKQAQQSGRDFGTVGRRYADFFADTFEGKLAEVGLARFLKDNFGILMEVDFKIYPGLLAIDFGQDIGEIIQNGDVKFSAVRLDAKATRAYSKWLLVESHKFWADAYVAIKVDLPRDFESDPKIPNLVPIEVCGFAYYQDLIDQQTKLPWFLFSAGDCLFDPIGLESVIKGCSNALEVRTKISNALSSNTLKKIGSPLKAPRNFGLPLQCLRSSDQDWAFLINLIRTGLIDSKKPLIFG